MIVLMSPKDMHHTRLYEAAHRLVTTLEGEEVVLDRELFDSSGDYRRRWKEVYGPTQRYYLLPRPDGTVGRGIRQQRGFIKDRGASGTLLVPEGEGHPHSFLLYAEFSLEVMEGAKEKGDSHTYATVSPEGQAERVEVEG